jgi:hypothetical protein
MPKWGQLVGDVLLQILNRLSFVDVQRAKTVCSHWNSVAKQLKLYTKFHGIPCLLIFLLEMKKVMQTAKPVPGSI